MSGADAAGAGGGGGGAGAAGAGGGRGGLELRAASGGLLDEPLALNVRGLGGPAGDTLIWRARLRDDDGRVWRAQASDPLTLSDAWTPAKSSGGAVAALQSLRPVSLDVRVEAPDGRAASRTLTRSVLAEGARVRRWRDGLAATLFLPAQRTSTSALVLDGTADEEAAAAAAPTAALLASRGVLVLLVTPPRRGGDRERLLRDAAERLEQLAASAVELLPVPPPTAPGVPARADAHDRAVAWDELLARVGATPRAVPG
ncbi:MAG TPA: hypothetical protein VLK58_21130 [Conexibacter sp.]|nr:hypothetical protein [Conexibacter sp.]